jgi:hypothetical protein
VLTVREKIQETTTDFVGGQRTRHGVDSFFGSFLSEQNSTPGHIRSGGKNVAIRLIDEYNAAELIPTEVATGKENMRLKSFGQDSEK